MVGDALGVLHDALKFRAKDGFLNELMGDLSLVSAPTGQSLQGAPVWSERGLQGACKELNVRRAQQKGARQRLPDSEKGVPQTTRTKTEFTIVSGRVRP